MKPNVDNISPMRGKKGISFGGGGTLWRLIEIYFFYVAPTNWYRHSVIITSSTNS